MSDTGSSNADKPAQRDAPSFASRDAGDPAFWDERFGQGQTPWDMQGVPAEFRAFAEALAPCPTLVPGCGNGWEAGWLHQHGWPVVAIDFSAQAVASARRALGPAGAVVRQADFFTFEPQPPCRLIYERAFLCALPPALRQAYAARVAALLPPGGLLAGYFFLGDKRGGPPFAMPPETLAALLGPHFEQLEDRPSAAPLPVFGQGERWQVWRRRQD